MPQPHRVLVGSDGDLPHPGRHLHPRNCAFCAVTKGPPRPRRPMTSPPRSPRRPPSSACSYVVVTSVTRDDLADGGASHFVAAIGALRARIPGVRIETWCPISAGPPSSWRVVRGRVPTSSITTWRRSKRSIPASTAPPQITAGRSGLLRRAKSLGAATKSGLMIGLGEPEAELLQSLSRPARASGCDLLTSANTSSRPGPTRRWPATCTPGGIRAVGRTIALDLGFSGRRVRAARPQLLPRPPAL